MIGVGVEGHHLGQQSLQGRRLPEGFQGRNGRVSESKLMVVFCTCENGHSGALASTNEKGTKKAPTRIWDEGEWPRLAA
jgi:hypothetical protein